MNKLYLIFSHRIYGMGGGQMYTYNKKVFMKENGWDCLVYSGFDGEIIIDGLKEDASNIFTELMVAPICLSLKDRKSVVDQIKKRIKGYSQIVIESVSEHMALWGEYVANKLKCKHIVHILSEITDTSIPDEYLSFYKFKDSRLELSCINQTAYKRLFRNDPAINDNNSHWLPSLCSNVISYEISYSFTKGNINYDHSLCCIGRLEKKICY